MKKVEAAKAQSIVGGTKPVCTSSYEKFGIGDASFCAEVKECKDKTGKVTSYVNATSSVNCA